MDENSSNIKCGCGFSANGPGQAINKEAFEAHTCFEGTMQATSWYAALLSFEGIVVLTVAGLIVVEIVKALSD